MSYRHLQETDLHSTDFLAWLTPISLKTLNIATGNLSDYFRLKQIWGHALNSYWFCALKPNIQKKKKKGYKQ